MSDVYRSGLRGFRPPLANGGHSFLRFLPGDEHVVDAKGRVVANPEPVRPTVWKCCACHVVLPSWALSERFYPRPCMGGVARLERGVTG